MFLLSLVILAVMPFVSYQLSSEIYYVVYFLVAVLVAGVLFLKVCFSAC